LPLSDTWTLAKAVHKVEFTITIQHSSATRTTPLRSSAINIRSDTFLQPPFGRFLRISCG